MKLGKWSLLLLSGIRQAIFKILLDFFISTVSSQQIFRIQVYLGGNIKQNNYTAFRYHSRIIEDYYKPKTEKKNKYTLMGDVTCNQREKLPIYTGEAIAEADLFLYQV